MQPHKVIRGGININTQDVYTSLYIAHKKDISNMK